MAFSADTARGFALAAAIAGDRAAARAAAGVHHGARDRWLARAQELADLDRGARRALLRAWTQPRRLAHDPGGHPRGRSLLAAHATPPLGHRLLVDAPAPRPGFSPEPELIQVLRRVAEALNPASPQESERPWDG